MNVRSNSSIPANEPRSLLRIMGIFQAIARSRDGMTLAELSAALAAPKSSLLLLLRPLVAHNYLVSVSGQYALGRSIFQLSSEVLSAREFTKQIRPYIDELAERSGESVYLAVLDPEVKVSIYIEGIESRQAVRYAVPVGTTRPLYASAAGKAMLAFQEDSWIKSYIKNTEFKSLTSKPVIKKTALHKELITIRQEGLSINIGDAVEGAAGIAAPIAATGSSATHALLIVAPIPRFEKALPALRELLLDVTQEVSGTLGNTLVG